MRTLLATLLFTLTTACAIDTQAPSEPTPLATDNDQPASPAHCRAACRVSLGLCGDEDRQLLAECTADCPFTASEATCLAALSCGDDVAGCDQPVVGWHARNGSSGGD
jgi:hypothetical protein